MLLIWLIMSRLGSNHDPKLFLVTCVAVGVAFVLLRQRILFRIQEAVHLISNLWLELVIILFPAAFLSGLTAKVVQYMAHQSTTKKNEEEVERPATIRSGRAITRRSEIDFFLFSIFSTNSERTGTFLFC